MILLPSGLYVPPRIKIFISFPTYFSAENPCMRKLSIPIIIHYKSFFVLKGQLKWKIDLSLYARLVVVK